MAQSRHWPEAIDPYKRTPEFTETSVPAGLLRRHSTKPEVWARLHVLAGTLIFRDLETGTETRLLPGIHPLIHPEQAHEVEPVGPVRFFVEFCRAAGSPPRQD